MFPIATSHGFRALLPVPTRNILEADLDCNGERLCVYVNHWPAKVHPESERLAVAQALAQRIAIRGAGMPYVIIGDLNSDYDEWRTFRTRGFDDTKGLTGLNHVLGTICPDSTGSFSFVTKAGLCRTGRFLHFDCWLDVPLEKRMSMSFRGLPETPDHILLPRALLCGSTFTYCDSSFTPFTWDNRLLRGNTLRLATTGVRQAAFPYRRRVLGPPAGLPAARRAPGSASCSAFRYGNRVSGDGALAKRWSWGVRRGMASDREEVYGHARLDACRSGPLLPVH